MLKNMMAFYNLARRAVESSSHAEPAAAKASGADIKERMGPILYQLSSMKFKDPIKDGEEAIKADYDALFDQMVSSFRAFGE